ncbi:MAG: NAD(P)-dependent glycerol-3-phosphate dehydrogenase [Oscillospiraceae bacterium]|nr:NAD(P)-dependent glycerol-3-phosphate dehydrogenase [Oscillospiraceae bacterium]
MSKITILGSGGFGMSLAVMLFRLGHEVTVWSAFEEELQTIKKDGEHRAKLPGVKIPSEIKLESDISCITGSDIVLLGIPSPFVRDVIKKASPYITENMIIVNTSKGLENKSLKLISEVICEEAPQAPLVILSGPSHAEEVALGIPTTVVAASENIEAAAFIQEIMSSNVFRIYINNDVVGCELGGALKNIIALCAGICDGLKYGDNTKAALMTRGLSEIARLGISMGANYATFAGLTGIGDLIVTCTSMHSRNRRAGMLIGQGVKPEEAVKLVGTVEGYNCCQIALALAKRMEVSMPITEQLSKVLFEGENVKDALTKLMTRPSRCETEVTL